MPGYLNDFKRTILKVRKGLARRRDRRAKKLRHLKKYGRSRPPAELKSWLQAVKHPVAFVCGGLKDTYDRWEPYSTDPSFRLVLEQSVGDYLRSYFDKRFLKSVRWMGVGALKLVTDLWVYQEIIHELQPDWIVEIGSHRGGTTLFLAQMLDLVGKGQVVTIDIDHSLFEVRHDRITAITGDCSSPEILEKVRARVQDGVVMVIHDGDHSTAAVARDLALYAPLVSPGSYLIVEDTLTDLLNAKRVRITDLQGGPLAAIRDFVGGRSAEFEIDRTREKFQITLNPYGYLRRRKPNSATDAKRG